MYPGHTPVIAVRPINVVTLCDKTTSGDSVTDCKCLYERIDYCFLNTDNIDDLEDINPTKKIGVTLQNSVTANKDLFLTIKALGKNPMNSLTFRLTLLKFQLHT